MSHAYRVLALGPARAQWVSQLTQWSTAGIVPVDITKCVSLGEVQARIEIADDALAIFVDASTAGLDRDFVTRCSQHNAIVIVIDHTASRNERWLGIGAHAVLLQSLTPQVFVDTLDTHIAPLSATNAACDGAATAVVTDHTNGALFVVCGTGGVGASTVAIALSQGLADVSHDPDAVLLADFARNAQQGMLHDANDVIPSIDELIESSRTKRVLNEEVRALTFDVPTRGYRLLLGMHRPSSWYSLTPRATEHAIAALRRVYAAVVADITSDFVGEQQSGSMDIEEQNLLNRTSARAADVIFAVTQPGMKGMHSLLQLLEQLLELGVEPERVIPIVNRAPKSAKQKAELSRCYLSLSRNFATNGLQFVHERLFEHDLRDGTRLHKSITGPLAASAVAIYDHLGANVPGNEANTPTRITPGSLNVA